MRRLVEGFRGDCGKDFGAGGAGEHAGAEGGLFGVEVVWRDAFERHDVVVVGYGLEVGGH
ncbi:hypothetical protein ABZT06_08655 [Streptomyces sp. NPDC005483]|uniref:hypothetical protein n=1 Tax=Streptomyces sp. NPDC005483 TaxID=3154882 RepID=UPI0033A0546B